MDLGIEGKKALVTGGGRGLGRSIAQCLAEEGATVAVVSRTPGDVAAFVSELGDRHLGIACDLMADGAPAWLVTELLQRMGNPDIVVHNLGGSLDETDPMCGIDVWRRIYRFNLEISVELNLAFIPHMQRCRWGRVVHISSIAALENQGTVPYCAIKAALNAYVRSLGRFVAPDGVNISALLPGAVFTQGGYWDITSRDRPEHVREYLDKRMAIHRFGQPDEIGRIAAFLCSQHASFVVGSAITVDGGQGRCFF